MRRLRFLAIPVIIGAWGVATDGASPNDAAPAKSATRPDPPVPPVKYLEAGAKLFNSGQLELAAKYLRAARMYRDQLTAGEQTILDTYFQEMARAQPNPAVSATPAGASPDATAAAATAPQESAAAATAPQESARPRPRLRSRPRPRPRLRSRPGRDRASGVGPAATAPQESAPAATAPAGVGPGRDRAGGVGPGRDRAGGVGPGRDRASGVGPGRDRASGVGPGRAG